MFQPLRCSRLRSVSAGVNLHTWTGWGGVPHWNAFVATLEMQGKGRFWDPRLNNPAQFPIAAAHGFGDLRLPNGNISIPMTIRSPVNLLRCSSISSPSPRHSLPLVRSTGRPRLAATSCSAEKRSATTVMSSRFGQIPAGICTRLSEVCIDSFSGEPCAGSEVPNSRRSAALFTHLKGGFYHDGRFKTLNAVVAHYNTCMNLGLTAGEQSDLIQYLLSLTFGPAVSEGGASDRKR